jgi:hypothetical protein
MVLAIKPRKYEKINGIVVMNYRLKSQVPGKVRSGYCPGTLVLIILEGSEFKGEMSVKSLQHLRA